MAVLLNFSQVLDDFIEHIGSGGYNYNTAYTAYGLFRCTDLTVSANAWLYTRNDGGTNNADLVIFAAGGDIGKLRLRVVVGGVVTNAALTAVLTAGTIYRFAIVRESATVLKLYIDDPVTAAATATSGSVSGRAAAAYLSYGYPMEGGMAFLKVFASAHDATQRAAEMASLTIVAGSPVHGFDLQTDTAGVFDDAFGSLDQTFGPGSPTYSAWPVQTAAPTAAAVTVAAIAPTLVPSGATATLVPAAAAVTVVGADPALVGSGAATAMAPVPGAVTVAGVDPVVAGSSASLLAPTAAAVAVAAVDPALTIGPSVLAPTAAAVTVAGVDPVVSGSGATLLAPTAAAVTVTAVAPVLALPKLSTLIDAFSVNSIGTLWTNVSVASGAASVADGVLHLQSSATAEPGAVESSTLFDLTESAGYVRLRWTDGGTAEYRILDASGDGYVVSVQSGGFIQLDRVVGGSRTFIFSQTYDPATMAWLQFREAAGTLFVERAADNLGAPGTFSAQGSEATATNAAFDPTQVRVTLANVFVSGASVQQLDGFNAAANLPLTPAAAAVAVVAVSPSLTVGTATITPAAADVQATAIDPALVASGAVAALPAAAVVAVSGVDPTLELVSGAQTISPAAADVGVVGVDPALTVSAVGLAPLAAEVTVVAVEPTVSLGALLLAVAAASIAVVAVDPSMVGTGNTTFEPVAAAVTVAAVEPVLAGSGFILISPAAADVAVAAVEPALTQGATPQTLDPAAADVTVAGVDPTLAGVSAVLLDPASAAVTVVGVDPSLAGTGAVLLEPAAADVAVAAVEPALTVGITPQFMAPAAADVTVVADDPALAVAGEGVLDPAAADVAVVAVEPVLDAAIDTMFLEPAAAVVFAVGIQPLVLLSDQPTTMEPAAAAVAVVAVTPTLLGGADAVSDLFPVYLAVPVILWEPDWSGPMIDMEFLRAKNRLDAGAGKFKDDAPYEPGPRTRRRIRYLFSPRAEVLEATQFLLEIVKGRLKPFWVPSWTPDLELVVGAAAADDELIITPIDFDRFYGGAGKGRRHLAIWPSAAPETILFREIVATSVNVDEDEVLTLDAALGVDLAVEDRVAFLLLCRADSDDLVLNWQNREAAILELPVIDLPMESS